MKYKEDFIAAFLIFIICIVIGYFLGNTLPTKLPIKYKDKQKERTIDSLDLVIEDLSKKKSILEKTIHWKQLELMDLNNEKRK